MSVGATSLEAAVFAKKYSTSFCRVYFLGPGPVAGGQLRDPALPLGVLLPQWLTFSQDANNLTCCLPLLSLQTLQQRPAPSHLWTVCPRPIPY